MKVKDYIGWLQETKWSRSGCRWHYYPNKQKSACGSSKHPKTQYCAVYIIGSWCKKCQSYCKKHGLESHEN